jgi:Domain of unknown function (DUF4258)
MKPVVLSIHAQEVMKERKLDLAWVELAANQPEWTTPDDDPELERRFRAITERQGRVIRVVCREEADAIFIVTAYFDRRARRPT